MKTFGRRVTKRLYFIMALVLALAIGGGTYAYTYTTTLGTIGITEPTADFATVNTTATQPDWNSVVPVPWGTETLRPNAAGGECYITNSHGAACPNHYQNVDEVTPDGYGTDVYAKDTSWERDLYNIEDHVEGSGTVQSVTVYARAIANDTPTQASLKIVLKSGATVSESVEKTLTTNWADYSNTWATNPDTGGRFTWTYIDSLQVGVSIRECTSGKETYVTQVYVYVDYGQDICGEVPNGNLFAITPAPAYSGDLIAHLYMTNTANLIKAYRYFNMKVYLPGSYEADQTPNYRMLTLQNGDTSFNMEEIAPVSGSWIETSQSDFEDGTLNQVDTTTSPGDVILDTFSDNVTDTLFTKIATSANVTIAGGQVKLTAITGASDNETLGPNAAGDETNIDDQYPTTGAHYDKVYDSPNHDGDGTYVETNNAAWQEDLYNLTNHVASTGVIDYVRVTMVARHLRTGSPDQESAYVHIKTNGQEYNGPSENLTGTYATYSANWTTNPQTLSAWTWSEIDTLQAGIGLQRAFTGGPTPTRYSRCTQVYVEVGYTPTTYYLSGTITSIDLLALEKVVSIDSFDYNASAIPSGTILKVQFSQDNTNWYSANGTAWGWDTLSLGTDTIDLSALGWSNAPFYYHMLFTSDGNDTPVLDEISVNFSTYYASGDYISSPFYPGYDLPWNWEKIYFTITEPSGTDIVFQIRTATDNVSLLSATWYGPTSTTDNYTVSGTDINSVHDEDYWIQYKAYFSGPGDNTPTLSDVTITYSGQPLDFIIEVTGGGYCLISDNTSEWGAGWTVTPELYCEVTQR